MRNVVGVLTVIALAIVAVFLYRVTTPESRAHIVQTGLAFVKRANQRDQKALGPFRTALRGRTPRIYATLAIVALNAAVFLGLVFGKGSLSEPSTLLAWGASVGPMTTNGEWWRLITATLVHPGVFALAIDAAIIVQIGSVLERIVGPFAFVTVFVSSALLAGLATLTANPTGVTWGSSGAIFGLYGALLVSTVRSWRARASFAVPRIALARFGIAGAILIVHEVAIGGIAPRAAFVALTAGVVFTLVFVVGVGDELPPWRRVAWGGGAALLLAVASAVPLRGIADVRPEIARLAALEQRTSGIYLATAAKFRRGALGAGALAQVIDDLIIPELQAADERLGSLTGVPTDDVPRVQDGREYLRWRSESYRLRAKALREQTAPIGAAAPAGADSAAVFRANAAARYRSSTLTLGRAETAERAALDTLKRLTTNN